MHSSTLPATKLTLSLDEVIARLPNIPTDTPNDAAIENYLSELYQLGRLRHIPNISPLNVAYLQGLLHEHQPQNILEVGSANGYSTLRLWQVARAWQAHITTLEVSTPTHTEAQHHIRALRADDTIHSHHGNALQRLPELASSPTRYDFILIDAQKIHTLDFFVRALPLASASALIVIDDVVKFRDKMRNFYDHLERHAIPYHIERLADDADGVMVIRRADCP